MGVDESWLASESEVLCRRSVEVGREKEEE